MDTKYIIFIVLVFIAAFFGLEALSYWWSKHLSAESLRIKKRFLDATGNNHEMNMAYQGILKNRYANQNNRFVKFVMNWLISEKLNTYMIQSGKLWSFKNFLITSIVCAIAFSIVFSYFNQNPIVLIIFFFVGFFSPLIFIGSARKERFNKLEQQLPIAIDAICRSLKAGHSFSSAIQLISEEFPDPISSEFRITIEENKLGVNINEALANMVKRIPLTDFSFFVIAVSIQRETGGNLAEILANISKVMRERFKLYQQIKVLSAEGRMSAWVLGVLPFLMMAFLSATSPKYSTILFHTADGQHLLKIAALMMVVAVFWMRSIVKIKF